jgi:hypothetical protein
MLIYACTQRIPNVLKESQLIEIIKSEHGIIRLRYLDLEIYQSREILLLRCHCIIKIVHETPIVLIIVVLIVELDIRIMTDGSRIFHVNYVNSVLVWARKAFKPGCIPGFINNQPHCKVLYTLG